MCTKSSNSMLLEDINRTSDEALLFHKICARSSPLVLSRACSNTSTFNRITNNNTNHSRLNFSTCASKWESDNNKNNVPSASASDAHSLGKPAMVVSLFKILEKEKLKKA